MLNISVFTIEKYIKDIKILELVGKRIWLAQCLRYTAFFPYMGLTPVLCSSPI